MIKLENGQISPQLQVKSLLITSVILYDTEGSVLKALFTIRHTGKFLGK